MKTKILMLSIVSLSIGNYYTQGQGQGQAPANIPSGGGQPGSAANPFLELYATDFIKVGNNSIFIDETNLGGGSTPENHIYSSATSPGFGNLYINSPFSSFSNAGHLTANTVFNFNDNTGGVGISTDVFAPGIKFHMADGFALIDGENSSLLFDKNSTSAYGQYGIEYLSVNETGSLSGLNFWKPYGSNRGLKNYIMFISDDGQVGIGVHPTEFKNGYGLFVNDGILCEQVRVAIRNTSDWMDVVFEEDYSLRSLQEVKSFITEYKHLPDVPSAEDVVEEGIDMAEMDATLLRKIEELTLYTIQQQELIEELQQDNCNTEKEEASEEETDLTELDAMLLQKIEELTALTLEQQELIEELQLKVEELNSKK